MLRVIERIRFQNEIKSLTKGVELKMKQLQMLLLWGFKQILHLFIMLTSAFIDPPKLYRVFAPGEVKELPKRALKNGLDIDQHPPDWLH